MKIPLFFCFGVTFWCVKMGKKLFIMFLICFQDMSILLDLSLVVPYKCFSFTHKGNVLASVLFQVFTFPRGLEPFLKKRENRPSDLFVYI